MPHCQKCGSRVSGEVCQNCGWRVAQTGAGQPTQPYSGPDRPPRRKSNIIIIIAVIVIVAIVIGAGVFFWILFPKDSEEKIDWGDPMCFIENQDLPGNYTGNVLRISGGDPPRLSDVTVLYTQGATTGSKSLAQVESEDMIVGEMTLSFSDNDGNSRLGGEDTFTISGVHEGDILRLIFEPTSGGICYFKF